MWILNHMVHIVRVEAISPEITWRGNFLSSSRPSTQVNDDNYQTIGECKQLKSGKWKQSKFMDDKHLAEQINYTKLSRIKSSTLSSFTTYFLDLMGKKGRNINLVTLYKFIWLCVCMKTNDSEWERWWKKELSRLLYWLLLENWYLLRVVIFGAEQMKPINVAFDASIYQ